MRNPILVILALLLPIVFIALLVTADTRQPPSWQPELDRYIEYKHSSLAEKTAVRSVERASRPWNFTPDMSSVVFGENPYYQTDYDYSGGGRKGVSRRLPYPPEKVWCALLVQEHRSASEPAKERTYTIVFVAEHHDLYNACMVIHEPPRDLSLHALMENLSRIGCDSVLEQVTRLGI